VLLLLLVQVGASKKLACVIDGESLMNDGSALVIFLMLQGLVEGATLTPAGVSHTGRGEGGRPGRGRQGRAGEGRGGQGDVVKRSSGELGSALKFFKSSRNCKSSRKALMGGMKANGLLMLCSSGLYGCPYQAPFQLLV
jgi:hypothetical protein